MQSKYGRTELERRIAKLEREINNLANFAFMLGVGMLVLFVLFIIN